MVGPRSNDRNVGDPIPELILPSSRANGKASARISSTGVNAIMLLCQKMVFNFGRSASGRYAPAFTGR
jgi:hypothetical protein